MAYQKKTKTPPPHTIHPVCTILHLDFRESGFRRSPICVYIIVTDRTTGRSRVLSRKWDSGYRSMITSASTRLSCARLWQLSIDHRLGDIGDAISGGWHLWASGITVPVDAIGMRIVSFWTTLRRVICKSNACKRLLLLLSCGISWGSTR